MNEMAKSPLTSSVMEDICRHMPLAGKKVLEVGCGQGMRSREIARNCRSLTAVDPDRECVEVATRCNAGVANLRLEVASAEALPYGNDSFDIVFFTLSLHHVPREAMEEAINESVRVAAPTGAVIFLEPGFEGSLFEAELFFDAGDGDERREKLAAYDAVLSHQRLRELKEFHSVETLSFYHERSFELLLRPKRHVNHVRRFLVERQWALHAHRRINIFLPIKESA